MTLTRLHPLRYLEAMRDAAAKAEDPERRIDYAVLCWALLRLGELDEADQILQELARTKDDEPVVPGRTLHFVETRDTGLTWFVQERSIDYNLDRGWVGNRAFSDPAAAAAEAERLTAEGPP